MNRTAQTGSVTLEYRVCKAVRTLRLVHFFAKQFVSFKKSSCGPTSLLSSGLGISGSRFSDDQLLDRDEVQ